MANRTKCTPDIIKRFADAVQLGATYELACKYAGISDQTYLNWMKWGEAGRQPYVGFFGAVKDAEGTAAITWLTRIEKAAKDGNWQAAAWKLERRYPEMYGRTVQDHRIKDQEIEAAAERLSERTGIPKDRAIVDIRERLKRTG